MIEVDVTTQLAKMLMTRLWCEFTRRRLGRPAARQPDCRGKNRPTTRGVASESRLMSGQPKG